MQTLAPGAAFGPYTIEGFVAGGGMGEVYAARHAIYGSPVALKVLHAELHADGDWRKRFNDEGLVGQQLKHPHVLAARELVQADGRVGLVLDLVRGGQTLLKVMNREFQTGVPLVASLQVFLSILQGVEYLHGKGIVHGDIKPENVMLSGEFRDPSTWIPLVTDFGTVALIADPVMIDGTAAVVASPRYATPEHLLGIDRVEVRSDIYALGLLLHYLLSGKHASDARTVAEAAERLAQPFSLVHLVDQPESVMDLVRAATESNVDLRYASCRDYALAIRRALDELGVKLQLEDLQADLATEVMEERLRMKQQAEAASEAGSGDTMEQDTEATELDRRNPAIGAAPEPPATSSPESESSAAPETEKVSNDPPPANRPSSLLNRDTPARSARDVAMSRSEEGMAGSDPIPPRAPKGRSDDDDEEGRSQDRVNPLWGNKPSDEEEEDISDAPTARLAGGLESSRDADPTVRLPAGRDAESNPAATQTAPPAEPRPPLPEPKPVERRASAPAAAAAAAGVSMLAVGLVGLIAIVLALIVVYFVVT